MGFALLALCTGRHRARKTERVRSPPCCRDAGVRRGGEGAAWPGALGLRGSGPVGSGGLSPDEPLPSLRQLLGTQFFTSWSRNRLLRRGVSQPLFAANLARRAGSVPLSRNEGFPSHPEGNPSQSEGNPSQVEGKPN